MTTYTGIGPSAERLSGRKGFAVGGLMGEAFNRKAAAPVPKGRQDLPDLLDPSEIQLREGDSDLVGAWATRFPQGSATRLWP
jgi:hypothetical protein